MYGNALPDGDAACGQFSMNTEQARAFRRSVNGVRTKTDNFLTSAFDVGAQIRDTATGRRGVITVAAPAGQMHFNIAPDRKMFEGDGQPIPAEKADKMSADIVAAAVANFMTHADPESLPAQ